MKTVSGLSVDLPAITAGKGIGDKDCVVISITAENQVYLNKDSINIEDLSRRIFELQKKAKDKNLIVAINGDEKASHGITVGILAALQEANVNQVFFETNERKSLKIQ